MSTDSRDEDRLRALMASYQRGRFEAFDEIYVVAAPLLRRYLLRHAADATTADDLLQDTCLQIHRARHTYDPTYPFLPWALAIARHVWLMHGRALSRRPQSANVALPEVPVRAEADGYAARADLRRALAGVSSDRRHALLQHHLLGRSFREIADRLGIAEAAAKLRSSRGVRDLRARLSAIKGSGPWTKS